MLSGEMRKGALLDSDIQRGERFRDRLREVWSCGAQFRVFSYKRRLKFAGKREKAGIIRGDVVFGRQLERALVRYPRQPSIQKQFGVHEEISGRFEFHSPHLHVAQKDVAKFDQNKCFAAPVWIAAVKLAGRQRLLSINQKIGEDICVDDAHLTRAPSLLPPLFPRS